MTHIWFQWFFSTGSSLLWNIFSKFFNLVWIYFSYKICLLKTFSISPLIFSFCSCIIFISSLNNFIVIISNFLWGNSYTSISLDLFDDYFVLFIGSFFLFSYAMFLKYYILKKYTSPNLYGLALNREKLHHSKPSKFYGFLLIIFCGWFLDLCL
jgi:hypothetical protein